MTAKIQMMIRKDTLPVTALKSFRRFMVFAYNTNIGTKGQGYCRKRMKQGCRTPRCEQTVNFPRSRHIVEKSLQERRISAYHKYIDKPSTGFAEI